jgi:hypothetical protein
MLASMADPGGPIRPTPISPPRRLWSDAEWDRLRRGAAGDGWTASLVGDHLTVAQDTTGKVVYAARFRRELAGWKVVAAEVESDPATHHPGRPEEESARLQSILERLVG